MTDEQQNETVKFYNNKHIHYIRKISADTESFEYLVSQHLRMSGVYWGLTAMSLLGIDLKKEPSYVGMVEWIMSCQDPVSGGYMFAYSLICPFLYVYD